MKNYYSFDDVLIVPQKSDIKSRSEINLVCDFSKMPNARTGMTQCCPIICANLDTTGTFEMAKTLNKQNCLTALHKFTDIKQITKFLSQEYKNEDISGFFTMGTTDEDFFRLQQIVKKTSLYMICVDVANGYSSNFLEKLKEIRKTVNEHTIILAGNVCTGEIIKDYVKAGVDIIKVGIGPGQFCTTRKVTGIGVPQFSAIQECGKVAHELGAYICADGGIREPGDMCKAFAAGADFVMCGGIFAGTDECYGEWETRNFYEKKKMICYGKDLPEKTIFSQTLDVNRWHLKTYGMSSHEAQKKYGGEVKDYRASEGKVEYIQYKGSAEKVLNEFLGGLRSCCSYVGATSLQELPQKSKFIYLK